jgi:hypothetical protein
MPISALRVQQSTSTTGTGTIALNAAASGRRSYQDAYGAGGARVPYVISGASCFEIGYGDFDGGSPGSLTRATVLASSNSGSLVSLPAGTADVFPLIQPSERGIVTGTGDITPALADVGNAIVWTGSVASTLSLPALATVPNGRGWLVRNAGTDTLTVDPNGTETVDANTSLVVPPGGSVELLRTGTIWTAFHSTGWLSDALARPPAIGGTTPAAGTFTTLETTGAATIAGALSVGGDISGGNLTAFKSAANAGITLNSSGGSGRAYQILSYTTGDFGISDLTAGAVRMTINSAGGVGIVGSATVGGALSLSTAASAAGHAPRWDQGLAGNAAPAQNLTSSRALGTTYTNSSSRPLFVKVLAKSSANGVAVQFTIDGNAFPPGASAPTGAANLAVSDVAIIPPGKTYSAAVTSGTGTLVGWIEW